MKVSMTKIFELDEKIADSVIKLNKKGYNTSFSCSGHIEDEEIIPYILFDRFTSYFISYYPIGWTKDKRLEDLHISRYFTNEEKDLFTKTQLIDMAMEELSNWVDSLPEFKNPYQEVINISLEDVNAIE